MMRRTDGQMQMIVLDLSELIPANHLLRKIEASISFSFIYDLLAPFYPAVGAHLLIRSVCSKCCCGISLWDQVRMPSCTRDSTQHCIRWFCGFELADKIPDHSTFSKTRIRKWNESQLFSKVLEAGLVDGKEMTTDGGYLLAQVSRNSWIDLETTVEQSMFSYLDTLDQELSEQPGFKKPPPRTIKKKVTTSTTDPECGYIHHGDKRGVGYLVVQLSNPNPNLFSDRPMRF